MGAARHRKPTLRTDWLRIIVDLQRNGMYYRNICDAIGVPLGTLYTWKTGSQPRYEDGAKLLDLWAAKTGNSVEDRPMVFV